MGAEGEASLPKPAYIPLIALDNFIERLRATGIPVVIDSNLTRTMSGGTASALMSALRFLGLVDQSGTPQDSLRKLVAAYHTDRWKDVFGDLVDRAYAGIIGDLDLTTATRSMLDDRFRKNSKAAGQERDKRAGCDRKNLHGPWTASRRTSRTAKPISPTPTCSTSGSSSWTSPT